MLYCLLGENTFVRREELAKLLAGREALERDGSTIDVNELPTLLAGQSLFDTHNTIVIDAASTNKALWDALEPWLGKLDADTMLILCETKLDKRTKTYKSLQKTARIINCDPLTSRDSTKAVSWLSSYAEKHGVTISRALAGDMVARAHRASAVDDRTTVIDQELLATAVKQLAAADRPIDEDTIETILPPALSENVFMLLEHALRGRVDEVRRMCDNLERGQQDGHQTFGLLASQVTTIAAIVYAKDPATVASDIGAHPYSVQQLRTVASACSAESIRHAVEALAIADEQLKSSRGTPWLLIEKALLTIALYK